jgi:hypothetical protein
VPIGPLIDLLAFWALMALGSFSLAVAAFVLFAISRLGVAGGGAIGVGIGALAIAGIVCMERAFVFWWRLR